MSRTKDPNRYQYVFLRHGESTGNAENRHQGQADYPLTQKGIDQAKILAAAWAASGKKFTRAISSPLGRAKQTADIITSTLNLDLEFDPIWMERDNGELAGLLHEDAQKSHPQPDFTPLHQPIAISGESQWDLFLRAGEAIKRIVNFSPGRYLIISHGGFLNMVVLALTGLTPQPNFQGPIYRFSNTGYTTVEYRPENDNWIIFEHNNTSHLNV